MRSNVALPALIAAAAAQQQTFSFAPTEVATTADNVEPTATETFSGPIQTGKACGQIADYVSKSNLEYPSVEAEVSARVP